MILLFVQNNPSKYKSYGYFVSKNATVQKFLTGRFEISPI